MVEFDIRVHPKQRQAYIPKEIVETLGYRWKVTPNMKAIAAYPKDATIETVIRSLEIILDDLKLRRDISQ